MLACIIWSGLVRPLGRARISPSVYQRSYHSQLRHKRRISRFPTRFRNNQAISNRCFSYSSTLGGQQPAGIHDSGADTVGRPSENHWDTGATTSATDREDIDAFAVEDSGLFEEASTDILQDNGFLSTYLGWAPDLVQSLLENIHVAAGLPWWLTIIAGTVCVRSLLLPVVLYSRKSIKRAAKIQPQLLNLQEKMSTYRKIRDRDRFQNVHDEMKALMKKHKVYPVLNLVPMFGQALTISIFFWAMRRMQLAQVEGLCSGGLYWFSNLTVPDPYFILPALSFAILATSTFLNLSDIEVKPGMKNLFHVMNVIFLGFCTQMPSGLCLYMVTSASYSLIYGAIAKLLENPKEADEITVPLIKPKKEIQTGGGKKRGYLTAKQKKTRKQRARN